MRSNNGLVLIKHSDNTTQGDCLILSKTQQKKDNITELTDPFD